MQSEPLTLGFDTSAAHCAAALLRGDAVLDQQQEEMPKGQAERLMPMLAEMLARQGLIWHDLTVIGVGIGPGNFTGVRIAVAAARGLALSLGIPAVGVSTLEARAHGLPRPLTVVEDARRGECYVQDFGPDTPPALATLATLAIPQGRALAGTAAATIATLAPDARLAAPAMPLAEAIARIAAARAATPQPRPAPLYLRSADALPPADPPPLILEGTDDDAG